ncbi:MAG: hypothetical protein AB7S39_20515, partial [Gemmatimonadales bacterium]
MAVVVVLLVAGLLAAGAYLGIERLGKPGLIPAALRFVAWSALGVLLLDLSCARPPETLRPLVLLDASLSMAGAGGRWREALPAAAALGEVRPVGALGPDSAPLGGRSSLAPALTAAAAAGRPVWLVTDGEIDDRADIPADLLGRAGVTLFSRERRPDLALTRVSGPPRIALGDTLRLDLEVSGYGVTGRDQVTVDVGLGSSRWWSGTIRLGPGGSGAGTISGVVPAGVAAGSHLLDVTIRAAEDAEPRTDHRLHPLVVLPTPGIVVLAAGAGWESRFFFRTLADVAQLPVKGYFRLDDTRWSRFGDLTPAAPAEVEAAVANADLLVRFGDIPDRFRRSRARARWEWVATTSAAAAAQGDWYLSAGPVSPVAGAFIGEAVDSFPPAVGLVALTAGSRDWVGLSGRLNRRGLDRPAVIGRDSAGRREILVGAAGLWRWAFRGGPSEQAYRAWVAASTSWLLGASDSSTGRARPVWPVVQQGRPVVFERLRPDVASLGIELRHAGTTTTDTLRFDGGGRAVLPLAPGAWDYRLEGGGAGRLGVEDYSDELLPRPVVLEGREPVVSALPLRSPLRERWWLFGLA